MALYLLHSTVPLRRGENIAVRHYVGYCRDGQVDRRVKQHRARKFTSAIIRAFQNVGGQLLLARVWATGTRDDEQWIKAVGHLDRLCPICTPDRNLTGDVGAWRVRRPPKSLAQR